jgi:hypothetical protein
VNACKHTKENRARLTSMSEDELLAYQREHHGDPYMSLGTAKELRKIALKFWHLGAASERAKEEARDEARRELRAKLWPGSADDG